MRFSFTLRLFSRTSPRGLPDHEVCFAAIVSVPCIIWLLRLDLQWEFAPEASRAVFHGSRAPLHGPGAPLSVLSVQLLPPRLSSPAEHASLWPNPCVEQNNAQSLTSRGRRYCVCSAFCVTTTVVGCGPCGCSRSAEVVAWR